MKLLPISFKPLCSQQPKTSSFRIKTTKDDDEMYKTLNSMYFVTESPDSIRTPESWFTNSSDSGTPSLTTDVEDELVEHNESHLEAIVRGAQQSSSNNHRLFFDPGETDSPRIKTQTQTQTQTHTRIRKVENGLMFKESVAMSVDSQDPYEDFKGSMEEMVESLGVRDDWEGLEALLRWYLKVNGKETHRDIINAFVDLVGDVIGNVNYKRTHYFCSTSGSANVHDHNNHDHNRDDDDNHDDDDPKISNSTTSFSSASSTLSSLGSNNELDRMIC